MWCCRRRNWPRAVLPGSLAGPTITAGRSGNMRNSWGRRISGGDASGCRGGDALLRGYLTGAARLGESQAAWDRVVRQVVARRVLKLQMNTDKGYGAASVRHTGISCVYLCSSVVSNFLPTRFTLHRRSPGDAAEHSGQLRCAARREKQCSQRRASDLCRVGEADLARRGDGRRLADA